MAAKMKNCSTCNAEIATDAKTCPSCGAKNKKPIYKRWWFILMIGMFVLSALGSMGDTQTPEANVPSQQFAAAPPATEPEKPANAPPANTKPANTESVATMGQKNALRSAQQYLDFTAFSYSGLVEQLEYEGYSHADAVWAVDRCGANWKEQAAKSAKDYLKFTSFSRQGLIDQLKFEGYTSEQAAYGVSAVGY